MKHIQTFLEVEESCQPERVLLNMMANLLKARDETFGEPNSVECRRFQQMISQKSFTGIPSSVGVVPSVPAANAQVEANPTFGEVRSHSSHSDLKKFISPVFMRLNKVASLIKHPRRG